MCFLGFPIPQNPLVPNSPAPICAPGFSPVCVLGMIPVLSPSLRSQPIPLSSPDPPLGWAWKEAKGVLGGVCPAGDGTSSLVCHIWGGPVRAPAAPTSLHRAAFHALLPRVRAPSVIPGVPIVPGIDGGRGGGDRAWGGRLGPGSIIFGA